MGGRRPTAPPGTSSSREPGLPVTRAVTEAVHALGRVCGNGGWGRGGSPAHVPVTSASRSRCCRHRIAARLEPAHCMRVHFRESLDQSSPVAFGKEASVAWAVLPPFPFWPIPAISPSLRGPLSSSSFVSQDGSSTDSASPWASPAGCLHRCTHMGPAVPRQC